jgi:hypothetical protein
MMDVFVNARVTAQRLRSLVTVIEAAKAAVVMRCIFDGQGEDRGACASIGTVHQPWSDVWQTMHVAIEILSEYARIRRRVGSAPPAFWAEPQIIA